MNGPLSIDMSDPRRKNAIMPLGAGGDMAPAPLMMGPSDEQKALAGLGQDVSAGLLNKGPLQDAAKQGIDAVKGAFSPSTPAAPLAAAAALNPGDAETALASATAAGGGVMGDAVSGVNPLGALSTLVSTGSAGKAVGQLAGQAAGQALIPIPVVGAAVGGMLGKALGGALGFADGTESVPGANSLSDAAIAQAIAAKRAQQAALVAAQQQPSIFNRILAMVMGSEGMLGSAKKDISGRQRQLDEAERKAVGYADGTSNVGGKNPADASGMQQPSPTPAAQSPAQTTASSNPTGGKGPALSNLFAQAGMPNPQQAAPAPMQQNTFMPPATTFPVKNAPSRFTPSLVGGGRGFVTSGDARGY